MPGAIDDAAHQQFRTILGQDSDAVQEIIEIYLEESADLGASLRTCLAAGDPAGVRRAAHSLKSTSRQLGAVRLGDLCGQIEEAAKDGDLDGVRRLAEDFDALLEASRDGLQARV